MARRGNPIKGGYRWLAGHPLVAGLGAGALAGIAAGVAGVLVATNLVSADDPDALEPGELVIVSGLDQSTDGQRKRLIDDWNVTHPDNEARIVELPADTDAAHSQMVADAQAGVGDIFNLDVVHTAEFAAKGYIRPLDESTADVDEFMAEPIETCYHDGKLYALPFNTDAGLLYYRNDLVPEPPRTWPQLRRAVENVFADPNHDPRLQYGYAGQLAPYEGLTVNALEAIQAEAGDIVRDGEIVVDLEDARAGIDRLRPASESGSGIVTPEALDFREAETTQAFREGRVLFMRNWPVAYRELRPPGGTEADAQGVSFGVTTLPGDSVLGGQNLAVAASSTKPRAAQALIEFLTDARSQQILFERGGFAATREVVYHDAEVTETYEYAGTLLDAVKDARPRPLIRCYGTFSEAVQATVGGALRDGRELPDDFVDTLQAALRC